MAEQVINAGDEVDSYCTSCKLMLAHRVVALVDDKPEKVECKTCGRKHKYRPNLPKSRMKKTATGKTTTRRRRTKDPAERWEESLAGKDLSNVKPYTFSGEFKQDDLIEHDTFGQGLVTEVMGEGKMEVIFKEGKKVMVYGKKM